MHIRFNGAGGHYNYLLGVASILQTHYDLSNVIFSGYSAGCVPAILLCLGLDINKEMKYINSPLLNALSTCFTRAYFNFIPYLFTVLLNRFSMISKDLYKKANHRMFCNLTHIPTLANHIYSEYTSNSDLVNCLLASGHIPFYNTRLFYTYRNQYYIDGGLSKMLNNGKLFECGSSMLELKTDMFRTHERSFIFIYTCLDYSNYLYKSGQEDALNNLKYFDKFLKRKYNAKL